MSFIAPIHRPRRLRRTNSMRALIKENTVTLNDIVWPVFITEGENQAVPVKSMAGVERYSIDILVKKIAFMFESGIKGFALFPNTPNDKKDETGTESINPNNLMNKAIRAIKAEVPECIIFADVALDPYTSHGHDGLIDDEGYVLNDETVKILMKQAVLQAQSGADVICPSDMMDGRIENIRSALDEVKLQDTAIMAYTAKYASKFYGPFRDAVGSSGALKGDKKTYQMDWSNTDEALKEVELDLSEGADMIMVKPGMPYLDIVYRVKENFKVPTFVYQVSGEYAMIQNMIDAGNMEDEAILESMCAFKRAGADVIFTYFAPQLIKLIK